jgi:hypothetical protein
VALLPSTADAAAAAAAAARGGGMGGWEGAGEVALGIFVFFIIFLLSSLGIIFCAFFSSLLSRRACATALVCSRLCSTASVCARGRTEGEGVGVRWGRKEGVGEWWGGCWAVRVSRRPRLCGRSGLPPRRMPVSTTFFGPRPDGSDLTIWY